MESRAGDAILKKKHKEPIAMIWNRERYIAHSLFEDTGREMFCELFGPLAPLEAEWRRQWAREKVLAMTALDWA